MHELFQCLFKVYNLTIREVVTDSSVLTNFVVITNIFQVAVKTKIIKMIPKLFFIYNLKNKLHSYKEDCLKLLVCLYEGVSTSFRTESIMK
jgi:hypothetical protein